MLMQAGSNLHRVRTFEVTAEDVEQVLRTHAARVQDALCIRPAAA